MLSDQTKPSKIPSDLLKPVNLKVLYFNYLTLTRITGDLTYTELQKIHRKHKADVQYVTRSLGGDANKQLYFIFIDLTYYQI